jgi:hypothetical protein
VEHCTDLAAAHRHSDRYNSDTRVPVEAVVHIHLDTPSLVEVAAHSRLDTHSPSSLPIPDFFRETYAPGRAWISPHLQAFSILSFRPIPLH